MRQPTAPFSVTAGIGASLHFAATVNLILHVTKIAIFCPDDSFRRDGLAGVRRAEPPAKASSFPGSAVSVGHSLKVIADCQAAQTALDSTLSPGFVSLEGYLSGRLARNWRGRTRPVPACYGHPRGRPVRYQRKHHHRRTEDAGRATQGLPDRHSEGRIVQGRRPAVML